jgi:hypothetical protein
MTLHSQLLILKQRYVLNHYTEVRNDENIIIVFLVNKTNRRNEFQFYWYNDTTCSGQPFCPSSGVLGRTSALVNFMQFDDRLLPGTGWDCSSILLLATNGHQTA